MPRARTVTDVILGEAVSGTPADRYRDMLSIASVVANRARTLGVPLEDVVQNTNEFNAYNRPLPPGVEAYRDLADGALMDVIGNGPITTATFYATPAAANNLPSGLANVGATTGHQYFVDPQFRAIGTAQGYMRPDPVAGMNIPTPSPRPGLGQADAAFGMMSALDPVRTGVVERGVLGPASAAPAGPIGPAAFDAARFGSMPQPQAQPQMGPPSFDAGRFGSPPTMGPPSFDAARFGSPAASPQMSYADMTRPAQTTPNASMNLADQYASYGQGRMAAQQALAPQIAAANLAQDVADRKATMPTMSQPQPAAAQPSAAQPQQNYVDPYVSASPTRPTAPGAISPSQQLSPNMQAQTFSQPPNNSRMKAGLGGIAGAVLGSAVAGPIGGALLGTIGANVMAGQPALTGPGLRGAFGRGPTMMANGFPSAPRLGLATRLSNFATGRDPRTSDLYRDSQQVRDAVDSGSAGLW